MLSRKNPALLAKTSNSRVLGNSAERSFDPPLILCVSACEEPSGGRRLGRRPFSHRFDGSTKLRTTLWNPDKVLKQRIKRRLRERSVAFHKTRIFKGFLKS